VGLLFLASLLLSNAAFASSTQPLTLTMTGAISSVGGQFYYLNQVGGAAYASVNGHSMDPSSSHVQYSLFANVQGGSATGHGTISLDGTTYDGKRVDLDAKVTINGMIPAEQFQGSAIPGAFIGLMTGSVTVGAEGSAVAFSLPVSLESPFINPFGEPIVVASLDPQNSIVLATGYQSAKIVYSNVQVLTFSVTGAVGDTPISAGSATLRTWAIENLYAGTESEVGTISFQGMNPGYLDSSGFYAGKSVIPSESDCLTTYGFSPCTFDCTPELPLLMGVPTLDLTQLPAGLCTVTGFISSGTFHTHGADAQISGNYATVWDIPAVSFGIGIPPPFGGSTITGTVSS